MDDTVADTLSRHLDWYNNEFGQNLTKADTLGKKIYDVVPAAHLASVRAYPTHPDFFRDLPIFDNAVAVIKQLNQRYDIYFASAAMEYPSSFQAKFDWLKQHFDFIDQLNFIFCGYKGMLNCDYLIDDSPRHLDAFSGKGLLFKSEANEGISGYDKVENWLDVETKLLKGMA
jgi:5'(3')-deoxyribonucleotidase